MSSLLADRRLRRFYLAVTISALGDYALYLALGVWVKLLTGSTSLAGICFLALLVGSLFAPVAGILVDRVRRRPLMIWTYVLTAGLLFCLLAVHDRHQVWLIYVVSFLYGLSGSISGGADQALMQQLVPEHLLATANSARQSAMRGLRLITPIIGVGLLGWLGGHAVVIADAVTFLIGAACLLLVRISESAPGPSQAGSWAAEISTGFRYLARTAELRQYTLAFAVAVFVLGFFETLTLQIVTVSLHHAPTWVGLFVTLEGIGGLAGGLTAAAVARVIGDRMLAAAGLGMMAVICLIVAVPNSTVVLLGAVAGGVALPWILVGGTTMFQKNTPNELMGRVRGAADLATQAPQTLGIAIGAALVRVVFYQNLCVAIAIVIALAAIYLGTRKSVGMPALATEAGGCQAATSAAA
jgi:MFS family permease